MTAVNLRTKTFFHGLSSYQHNISSVTLILACRSNSQRKLLTNCSGEPLYIKAPTYMAMRLGEQYKRNLIIHPSTSVKVIFFCFILPSTWEWSWNLNISKNWLLSFSAITGCELSLVSYLAFYCHSYICGLNININERCVQIPGTIINILTT